MTDTCANLDAYLDGELDSETARRFEGHCAGCSPCSAVVGRQRELDRLLALAGTVAEPVPAGLVTRIDVILQGGSVPASRLWRVIRYAPLAAAAVLALTVTMVRKPHRSPAPNPLGLTALVDSRSSPASHPSQQALAQLAVLVVQRADGRESPTLACVGPPAFPTSPRLVTWAPVGSRPRRQADESSAEGGNPPDDGPKRGLLRPFNAASIQSAFTIGERKFDRIVIESPPPPEKESIPC